MISPELATAAVVVGGIVAAAAYSYLTGNESSVDLDNDGEDELTFEGEMAVAETSEEDTDDEDPTPDSVRAKDGLTDVKGIADTRADALAAEGFTSPKDLYYASDDNLTSVDGIGPYTVDQIREDIGSVDDSGNSPSDEESEQSSS